MKLKLKISPCPNDTFAFHAMIHNLVETYGIEYEVEYLDIDTLNSCAINNCGDVVKVSCAVLPKVIDRYTLLSSGGAMGYGNGPIVVYKDQERVSDFANCKIALPGEFTTAKALLENIYGKSFSIRYMRFDKIADAVASGEVDAGVLIHEGRFTFQDKGLLLYCDLGELWHTKTLKPIPLGCIIASKSLDNSTISNINSTIRSSVEFAMANRNLSREYIKHYAQELSDDVIDKHIDYFVNQFTIDMGGEGREAIELLNK